MRGGNRAVLLVLFWLAAGGGLSRATTYAWMPAKAFLAESDLIAVVEVGPVHEVSTPEGFILQSAQAKIVTEVFRRSRLGEDGDSVVIYSLHRNVRFGPDGEIEEKGGFSILPGKAFVCLKMGGMNKFHPFEPLSFQPIGTDDLIMWATRDVLEPGSPGYEKVPVARVVEDLRKRLQSSPPQEE